MEITSIQDKNIAARTHDGNYANYMQILDDTIVLIVTNVRNKYDRMYDIYVNVTLF